MFSKSRLEDILIRYKQDFVAKQWPNEKYKWEAIKCFQENWNAKSSDFSTMLKRSLSKTINLLASQNNYPLKTIGLFADIAPEEVRAMFIALFDETQDVYGRINSFKTQSLVLLEKYGDIGKQHYQYENAISTYLWLYYPDKYYIYKYGEIKTVAEMLESDYRFKKGAYSNNIRNAIKLYDELCAELQHDEELVSLLKSQLTDSCYSDPCLKTLTIDVGFYISRYYSNNDDSLPDDWFPSDYAPGLDVQPLVHPELRG